MWVRAGRVSVHDVGQFTPPMRLQELGERRCEIPPECTGYVDTTRIDIEVGLFPAGANWSVVVVDPDGTWFGSRSIDPLRYTREALAVGAAAVSVAMPRPPAAWRRAVHREPSGAAALPARGRGTHTVVPPRATRIRRDDGQEDCAVDTARQAKRVGRDHRAAMRRHWTPGWRPAVHSGLGVHAHVSQRHIPLHHVAGGRSRWLARSVGGDTTAPATARGVPVARQQARRRVRL